MHLIVTDDRPPFAQLAGTSILYLKNTSSHVFREPTNHELYVFISAEWYRAWTTDGPWERLSKGIRTGRSRNGADGIGGGCKFRLLIADC